ncbi:MAG: CDP-diacylglycerol--glycerol-3-phosphate 3-phosphatidyltransferase [Clostridia bacterium]|nr:CDP-diacylglycerol--glycerol-3-phosphate 3-phosphatidyltransferase [Clostridia bacterium]MDD4375431.1 CDP-diacylglycerol--glycerol-3-phosphate 3-phosphatidyltransferase [Clostridia bacterium]
MNLPNKLTMLRIVLVPVFIILMVLSELKIWDYMHLVALGIFIIAAITDYLDGKISRKRNIVTEFGKIMDPLADKLLVSSALIMLVGIGKIPAWIVAIIIARDFFASSLRMFGSDNGVAISAVRSGKIKTLFQMIGIILVIVDTNVFGAFLEKGTMMGLYELSINVLSTVSISLALLATLWSLVDYIVKFGKHINVEK